MILTPHTIAGVAIASIIPNPIIAVPTAFVFHFLGDLVPHWDYYSDLSVEERRESGFVLATMADMAIGIAVGIYFTLRALWILHSPILAANIFLCGIASVLPDAFSAPALLMKNPPAISKAVLNFQGKVHHQIPYPWGLVSQLIVVAFCLLVVANLIGL